MQKISPDVSFLSRSSFQSNYRKTVLPNGIRVVSEEIPYVRSISVGVWIDVGSRDENRRTNGISHFLEHMVFKGTRRYSSQQIARSLEGVGGYLNAFTTKEHTCFYARVLDDQLAKAIDVLSELAQHPVFRDQDIEKEKTVVLEELKNIEDDPEDLIHEYFDQKIFHRHPLGRPIIGNAENIRNFSKSDLIGHTRQHYRPGRIVVSAAGNLEHEALVALVDRYFHPARTPAARQAHPGAPLKARGRRHVVEKPIMQAHVCLGTLGYSARSRRRHSLLVLNTLLGEGMSSRLFQNVRERWGFAYTIYSFVNFLKDTGSFGVYVGTDVDKIDRSIELITAELKKLTSRPVTDAELNRTKAQLKGTMVLSLESMSNRMMRLGNGELYFGKYFPVDDILKSIDAVNADGVGDVASRLFHTERFSTIIIKPASESRAFKGAA